MQINDLVGQQIDGFEILRKLGQGGMGVVYLARQTSLHRLVAFKIIAPSLADTAAMHRFRHEAEAAASLSHPGIVPIFTFGHLGRIFYYSMEYVDGTTLAQILDHGPLPPLDALHVIEQVAGALEYAHGRHVIHRDIKPQNIMIGRDKRVRVLDFGIAKIMDAEQTRVTLTGDVVGTTRYASPEQMSGRGQVDPRTDIYSLGSTLFEALTGDSPGVSDRALQERTILDYNPMFSPELSAFVEKMRAIHPEGRQQNMSEVLLDIQALKQGRLTISKEESNRKRRAAGPMAEAPTRLNTPIREGLPPTLDMVSSVTIPGKKGRRRLWLVAGGALLALLALAAIFKHLAYTPPAPLDRIPVSRPAASSGAIPPRAPGGAGLHKVSIDPERRCLAVDGEPLFVLACVGVEPGHLRQAAELGFNSTVRFGSSVWRQMLQRAERGARRDIMRQYLDAAYQNGLMVIEHPEMLRTDSGAAAMIQSPQSQTYLNTALPEIVEAVRDHPALLAYFATDLPVTGIHPTPPDAMLNLHAQFKNTISAHDPDHPVYLDFRYGGQINEAWSGAFDIAGGYEYSWANIPLGLPLAGNPRNLLLHAQALAYHGRNLAKPVLEACTLQTIYSRLPYNVRQLNGTELRLQAWLAVFGHARGLVWWVWPPITENAAQGIRQVLGELRKMAPVLLEPRVPLDVVYFPLGLRLRLGLMLPVFIQNHAGQAHLFVANLARFPVQVTFNAPPAGGTGAGKIESLLSGERLDNNNGKFSDRFAPCDVKIYRLPRPWPTNGLLEVTCPIERPPAPTVYGDLKKLIDLEGPNLVEDPRFTLAEAWPQSPVTNSVWDQQGRTQFVSSSPDPRNIGLRLETSDQRGKVLCYEARAPVSMEPRSRYLFTAFGYIYSQSRLSACAGLRVVTDNKPTSWTHTDLFQAPLLMLPDLGLLPETVGLTFVTGAAPVSVKPVCLMGDGQGGAWFHEITLKKLPNSKNILRNSGFEQEGAPGEPRCWEAGSYTPPIMPGEREPFWALDPREKFEGAMSLRLFRRIDEPQAGDWMVGEASGAKQRLNYAVRPGEALTLSFWAKSDQSNFKLLADMEGMAKQVLMLNTQWQRYTMPVKPRKKMDRFYIALAIDSQAGTAWIDAVQLEAGSQATAYEVGGW